MRKTIKEAKRLINNELEVRTGTKMCFNDRFNYLALGVKIGEISPAAAAVKILEACTTTRV